LTTPETQHNVQEKSRLIFQ